jgi:hypothetical protein
MNMTSQKLLKLAEICGAICGGLLISVPAISQTAVAQQPTYTTPQKPTSKVNPCPGIFYEEPHNNRVLVPQGCPPNAITQRLADQGLLPAARTATQSSYQTGLGVGGETPQAGASKLNPCPRIYYEEPFNSRNVVPQGCPPNAFSQGRQLQGETSSEDILVTPQSSGDRATTPQATLPSQGETSSQDILVAPQTSTDRTTTETTLPSQQQAPRATIALADGRVNIRLVNNTGARVTYQVIGDTEPRSLEGQSNVMLQGINAPATLTFQREDGGLLAVTPQPSSEQPGMLEVTFDETTDQSQDTRAMRIQQNGSVFLN